MLTSKAAPASRTAAEAARAEVARRAHAAIRDVQCSGAVAGRTPDIRRLDLAKDAPFRVEKSARVVVIGEGAEARVDTVASKRIRVDDQFQRLVSRGQLAPNDPDMNRILGAAGFRFRDLNYMAGLETLKAMDPSKGFTTKSSDTGGLFGSELRCERYKEWDAAVSCLSQLAGRAVDQIVVQDRQPVEVGRVVSVYRDEKLAVAVALHELRTGLRQLARHFGLIDPEAPRSAVHATHPDADIDG